ncbi:probable E3 ubiquitin-protein ligase makorin-1 isoform X2 [Atheta coriaria]
MLKPHNECKDCLISGDNSNRRTLCHQKCLNSMRGGKSIHSNRAQKWEKLRAKMDCQHPSTSDVTSASSVEDDSLGAADLKRHANTSSSMQLDKQWNIDAPEFVPRTRFNSTSNAEKRLCPFAAGDGFCKYPPGECTYLHGTVCDMCGKPALHPFNEEARKKHTQECIKRHERDMEHAFAVARSKEKICGICFEVIMQKNTEEQRFGILPSCNHCFCLTCIRRWRQSKQFENKIIRSCPECRIPSDFVCPSAYWVDTKEDKQKVIDKYKSALAKKDCKYFRFGRGHCPFGNKCFYRHCLQNGKRIDVGPPPSTNGVGGGAEALLDFPNSVEIIQSLLAAIDVAEDDDESNIFFEVFEDYCLLDAMFNLLSTDTD